METNGEVRMSVRDINGKSTYKWVFAGNAHAEFGESIVNDLGEPRLNFDFVMEATERNKLKEKKKNEKRRTE